MTIHETQHQEKLIKLRTLLVSSYKMRDSDNLQFQNGRSADSYEAEMILRNLVSDVLPDRRLVLSIGYSTIRLSRFWMGQSDAPHETREPSVPGYNISLEESILFTSEAYEPIREELYVGGGIFYVRQSSIGEGLSRDSRLSMVEVSALPAMRIINVPLITE